jgi:vacuolar-type H+-ATPase subunit E/Vma4
MSEQRSILDTQLRSMMEYLRRYEVEQIEAQLDESHRTADEIIRSAHRRARERMRTRFQRERRRLTEAEQSAAARVATQRRLAKHARINNLIEDAWDLLPEALEKRWADGKARSEWCEMLLRQALRSLPGPEILVEHPQDWASQERQGFLERIQTNYGRLPEARAVTTLRAGLRIHSDHACLDGSVAGLLAQRRRVEAELLLHLTRSDEAAAGEKRHG